MTKNKNSIIKIFFTFLMISQLIAVQSATALGENETTVDYKEKIMNTSQALGISVYEDFPVEFEGEDNATKDAQLVYADSSDNKVTREIIPALANINKSGDTFEVGFWDSAAVMWHNAGFAAMFVGSQIADSGYIPWVDAAPSFEELSDRAIATLKNSRYKHGKKGVSLLENDGFIKELEDISGAKFTDGNSTDYLIDGPESFAMKNKLMGNAKKSIYVTSWAIYDDITGKEAADLLIAKHQEGLDIKVMVDGKVVGIHGAVVIKMMEDAGIEVLRYQEKGRDADIWHVKMILIDDEYSIVGGMNFGDVYSHRGGGPKWRDTEVLYSGPAVIDSRKIFMDTWNGKIKEDKLKLTPVKPFTGSISSKGNTRIAPVLQNPPTDSKVLLSMLKGIYGAGKTVNIENAYFVAIPAVIEAIQDALKRGVEVNILTNSDTTLNEQTKFMVVPSLKSLAILLKAGANIYLHQGDTLHSKFMTVDGIFANLGSYNLHPRGERYDTEVNVNILGADGVRELDEAFQNDISKARKITTVKDLGIEETWLSGIIEDYFLAQLSPGK